MEISTLITNKGLQMSGTLLISSSIFIDDRGFFMESWNQEKFNSYLGQNTSFVQDNHSQSVLGVLRGLHYQLPPKAQGKLVRCVVGEIFDVAVDLRRESKTFCQWVGVHLGSENKHQLWIPPGFAHGFLSLTDSVEIIYKVTDYWNRSSERSIRWDDPTLNISWPKISEDLIISDKDSKAKIISTMNNNDFF